MSGDKDLIYLAHIAQCIEAIKTYTIQGQEEFLHNSLVQDAVLRRLQIMAESSQRLSDKLKAKAPNVDWKALSGFRNILVHDYLGGISLEQVWNAIANDLPVLKEQVESDVKKFWRG